MCTVPMRLTNRELVLQDEHGWLTAEIEDLREFVAAQARLDRRKLALKAEERAALETDLLKHKRYKPEKFEQFLANADELIREAAAKRRESARVAKRELQEASA